MAPKLDIIIVNRNSGDLLFKCLSSIALSSGEYYSLSKVVIVDDVSSDASLVDIEKIDLPLKLICNEKRSGYGASCNIGARECKGDYILFLNTDVILNINSLDIPIHYLEQPENSRTGIVGIKLCDEAGDVQKHCSRFPTASMFISKTIGLVNILPSIFPDQRMLEWDHLETRRVDQVIGAVMFMRRNIFEKLKGYDERFFVYCEDLDLSLRTANLGFKSIYLDTVSAYHYGGFTARNVWLESMFLNLRSKTIYAFKHFSILSAVAIYVNNYIIEPIIRIIISIARFSRKDIIIYMKLGVSLWINLPLIIIKGPRINWPFQ